MSRKSLAALAAVISIAGTSSVVASASPASAYRGTPGCVTLTEFRSISDGMSQTQVARRFGTYASPYWGHVTFTWDSDFSKEVDREWRICNRYGKPKAAWSGGVEVDFEKESDWDTGEFPPGPLLSTYKNRWSF